MSVSLSPCLFSIWSSKIIYNSFFHSRPLTSSVSHIDTALDISILLSESPSRYKLLQQNKKKFQQKDTQLLWLLDMHTRKDAQPQFLLPFNSPAFLWYQRRPSSPKSRNGLWGVLLCAIDRVGQNMACYFCIISFNYSRSMYFVKQLAYTSFRNTYWLILR